MMLLQINMGKRICWYYTQILYTELNQFGQLPVWFHSPQLASNGLHIDNDEGNLIVGVKVVMKDGVLLN